MKKKGAISFYIILGVALLLIAVILFSFSNKTGYEFSKDVVSSNENKQPVQFFVHECIKETAINGLSDIGSQSGYINLSSTNMDRSHDSSKASGVYLGDIFVPYWHYLNKDNKFDSKRPPLCKKGNGCDYEGDGSIEEHLSVYIMQNLPKCIKNFDSFKDEYKIEDSPYAVDTIIRENDVQINVVYPLKITSKSTGIIEEDSNFNTRVPVKLREIYDLASQITKAQSEHSFIEEHVLNMIALYSGIDSDNLPPMSELQIGSNKMKFWLRSNVETVIKNDILDLVRLMQVTNTKGFNPIVLGDREGKDALSQGIYNAMSFTAGDKYYNDLEVSFLYPSTPIKLSIDDSEIIFPKNKIPFDNFVFDLIGFKLFDYSFNYDLAFPVIVSIKAKNAINNRDLTFNFALEANIRNNVPLTSEFDLKKVQYPNVPMFESPSQRVNKTVKIKVYDLITNKSLPNTNVFYDCGAEAYIGNTKQVGEESYLNSTLPFCMFGGFITVNKEDYFTGIKYFNNQEAGKYETVSIGLYPIVKKKVEIRVINETAFDILKGPKSPLINFKDLVYKNSRPVSKNERVIFNINRINEDDAQKQIPIFGFINYKIGEVKSSGYASSLKEQLQKQLDAGEITKEEMETSIVDSKEYYDNQKSQEPFILGLIPGKYNIEAYVMYEDNITIPEKREEFCPCSQVVGTCMCKKQEVVYPKQTFNVFPIGGALTNVTLKENDLYKKNGSIIFYVFATKPPRTWDSMLKIKQVEDFVPYNYMLAPRVLK